MVAGTRAQAGVNSTGVGLVINDASLYDPHNWLSYQGLLRAESELGIVGTLYTSTSSADYEPNLQQCVDDGNDLCISVSFFMTEATSSTAAVNTGTLFATVDAEWEIYLPNLRGLRFANQEAAYLAGTLAGLMTESDVLGGVGGMQIPTVDAFLNPYSNGAQCVNPYATVLITYAGTFVDPDLGAEIAQ